MKVNMELQSLAEQLLPQYFYHLGIMKNSLGQDLFFMITSKLMT